MKNKRLHYIGYCVAGDETKDYTCNVASSLKMHYIADVADRAGFDVRILSMCAAARGFSKLRTNKSESIPISHIVSFGGKKIFARIANRILLFIQVVMYLLFSVKKQDVVLLYHSTRLSKICLLVKKIKKLHVVLEVEEIYAYSAEGVKAYEAEELKCIKGFERYIFVNSYIPQYLNIEKERYIVIYGSYRTAVSDAETFSDGKHHVVYAGAIETLNQGAFTAIQTARYLPSDFVVHILGNGTDENLNRAKREIAEINAELGREAVRYEGFMSGQALDDFLCRCDVGLSAYQIKEMYSDFVFPSKLVSYMCHDLNVVTGRSRCYEEAPIAKNWVFYDDNNYESIAHAIQTVFASDRSSSADLIQELDNQAVSAFGCLRENGVWEIRNEDKNQNYV